MAAEPTQWHSVSTGAVEAVVLSSNANCGSFWPAEVEAGPSESKQVFKAAEFLCLVEMSKLMSLPKDY